MSMESRLPPPPLTSSGELHFFLVFHPFCRRDSHVLCYRCFRSWPPPPPPTGALSAAGAPPSAAPPMPHRHDATSVSPTANYLARHLSPSPLVPQHHPSPHLSGLAAVRDRATVDAPHTITAADAFASRSRSQAGLGCVAVGPGQCGQPREAFGPLAMAGRKTEALGRGRPNTVYRFSIFFYNFRNSYKLQNCI
jgi:hypothetical protein